MTSVNSKDILAKGRLRSLAIINMIDATPEAPPAYVIVSRIDEQVETERKKKKTTKKEQRTETQLSGEIQKEMKYTFHVSKYKNKKNEKLTKEKKSFKGPNFS